MVMALPEMQRLKLHGRSLSMQHNTHGAAPGVTPHPSGLHPCRAMISGPQPDVLFRGFVHAIQILIRPSEKFLNKKMCGRN